ncbi:hypothetical protein HAX54_022971, partial [Datura stramonium]|nr:hypothetical protein [Datura stramonium]
MAFTNYKSDWGHNVFQPQVMCLTYLGDVNLGNRCRFMSQRVSIGTWLSCVISKQQLDTLIGEFRELPASLLRDCEDGSLSQYTALGRDTYWASVLSFILFLILSLALDLDLILESVPAL